MWLCLCTLLCVCPQLVPLTTASTTLSRYGAVLQVVSGILWLAGGYPDRPLHWSDDGVNWSQAPPSLQDVNANARLMASGIVSYSPLDGGGVRMIPTILLVPSIVWLCAELWPQHHGIHGRRGQQPDVLQQLPEVHTLCT
jgi:hypothetical protein